MTHDAAAARIPSALLGAARVILGALWLHEGYVKYHAHFGGADILLLSQSASSNSRVPGYFATVAGLLHSGPGVFGAVIPLLETALGVALMMGVLTMPAALASLLTLMLYWSSDQLITEYPIMGALAGVVLAWPHYATHFSMTTLVADRLPHGPATNLLLVGPLRRWL